MEAPFFFLCVCFCVSNWNWKIQKQFHHQEIFKERKKRRTEKREKKWPPHYHSYYCSYRQYHHHLVMLEIKWLRGIRTTSTIQREFIPSISPKRTFWSIGKIRIRNTDGYVSTESRQEIQYRVNSDREERQQQQRNPRKIPQNFRWNPPRKRKKCSKNPASRSRWKTWNDF